MKNVIDFPDPSVIEHEASDWIVRFDGLEQPSERDISELKAWTNTSAAHREALIRLAVLWNNMSLLSVLQMPDAATQPRSFTASMAAKLRPLSPRVWVGVSIVGAAAILLAVVTLSQLVPGQRSDSSLATVYVTGVGESTSAILSDGSTLWLNTNSSVSVEYNSLKRRVVLRQGEAHFEVVKDTDRPFEVYAGSRLVRAIGTAFSVFRDQEDVRVMVSDGRVELASIPPVPVASTNSRIVSPEAAVNSVSLQGEIIGYLGAGQSVTMPADAKVIPVESVVEVAHQETVRQLSWREGRLMFAGESLEEVVREVSRYTSMHIEIVDESIQQLRVGGQFQIGEVSSLFDVLEFGFGLEVSRLGEEHVQIRAGESSRF